MKKQTKVAIEKQSRNFSSIPKWSVSNKKTTNWLRRLSLSSISQLYSRWNPYVCFSNSLVLTLRTLTSLFLELAFSCKHSNLFCKFDATSLSYLISITIANSSSFDFLEFCCSNCRWRYSSWTPTKTMNPSSPFIGWKRSRRMWCLLTHHVSWTLPGLLSLVQLATMVLTSSANNTKKF
jgi:hypothetical protein